MATADAIPLPIDLAPVLLAMHAVNEARDAEQAAYRHRIACEKTLAEMVHVRRRDKDMGFEADMEVERVVVVAAIAAALALPPPAPTEGEKHGNR